MPLYPSPESATPIRHFRSLVFGSDLEVILESPGQRLKKGEADIAQQGSVTNIDFALLDLFLRSARKEKGEVRGSPRGRVTLNNTLTIDLGLHEVYVKGYELSSNAGGSTFICSSKSETNYKIPLTMDMNIILTTLEYLLHVETCV